MGPPLGYLGSLSQNWLNKIFYKCVFLPFLSPLGLPILPYALLLAKKMLKNPRGCVCLVVAIKQKLNFKQKWKKIIENVANKTEVSCYGLHVTEASEVIQGCYIDGSIYFLTDSIGRTAPNLHLQIPCSIEQTYFLTWGKVDRSEPDLFKMILTNKCFKWHLTFIKIGIDWT